ncbi:3-phosphoshikimate 1-carboxyvinyltransferase [Candidatus Saccharibacteria bacterium]|nr:3-phosphoshikimate 1-carboxyvinyltransferase [Candidatus Saccharibacteria bacterium]
MKDVQLTQDKTWQPSAEPLRIEVPGSKSITNRALIASSINSQPITIINPSLSVDSLSLRDALIEIGIIITNSDKGSWIVHNSVYELLPKKLTIDCGPAGTTSRFLLAFVAFLPGFEVTITGSERLKKRSMGVLINALKTLGAQISEQGEAGKLPVLISGVVAPKERKIIEVDASVSSQFITALQLISPLFESRLEIIQKNQPVSAVYSDLTRTVQNQLRMTNEIIVEADAAAAGYMWAFGMLRQQAIKIPHISPTSAQGDIEFVKVLENMGAQVSETADGLVVFPTEEIRSINYNMINCSDTAQTAAALATQADGESYIYGLSTLPGKETDRLVAMKTELERLGIRTEIDSASIRIFPGVISPARIKTYHDHRMAMSFSPLSAIVEGIIIEDSDVVEKSFPDFWSKLKYFGIIFEDIV